MESRIKQLRENRGNMPLLYAYSKTRQKAGKCMDNEYNCILRVNRSSFTDK